MCCTLYRRGLKTQFSEQNKTKQNDSSPLHHWNGCINAPDGVLAVGIRSVFTNKPQVSSQMDNRNQVHKWSRWPPPAVSKVSETITPPKRSQKTNKQMNKRRLCFLIGSWTRVVSHCARAGSSQKSRNADVNISPASPRCCGCFESVVINRRHDTDPAAASVCEGGETRAQARCSCARPRQARLTRGAANGEAAWSLCVVTVWCVSCSSLRSAVYWCMYVSASRCTVGHRAITRQLFMHFTSQDIEMHENWKFLTL